MYTVFSFLESLPKYVKAGLHGHCLIIRNECIVFYQSCLVLGVSPCTPDSAHPCSQGCASLLWEQNEAFPHAVGLQLMGLESTQLSFVIENSLPSAGWGVKLSHWADF